MSARTKAQRDADLRFAGLAAARSHAYFTFARAHLWEARAYIAASGEPFMDQNVRRSLGHARGYRRLAKEQRELARAAFCRGIT